MKEESFKRLVHVEVDFENIYSLSSQWQT